MKSRKLDGSSRGQFVKGAATTLILLVLDETPMHGYELIQTIRERSGGVFDFSDGTVYPLLYGLRDRGLVRSARRTSQAGRVRKVYSLTLAGRSALEQQLGDWRRFARGMELALGSSGNN